MTIQEYSDNLEKLHGLQDSLVNLVIAPNGIRLFLSIINRIQKQGKASSGGAIGQYSTKPAYFGQSAFVNPGAFKPIGKGGVNVGNKLIPSVKNPKPGKVYKRYKMVTITTGESRKSMYLPHGYKELRQIQGKQTDHVDQTYSGQTMADYRAEIDGQSMLIGFTTQRASKIRKGNERRFKQPIYSPTMTEIQVYKEAVNSRLRILTLNTIAGVTATASVQ